MLEYRATYMPQSFVIVGCGGTGSRLVPLLAQFIKTCNWVVNPSIYLVDDDVVEEKNLLRQNFISPDVGKPKAVVLANRYSRAFNVPIIPVVMRVEGNGKLVGPEIFSNNQSLVPANPQAFMVISCVDSMNARRCILNEFTEYWRNANGGILFLDGGNEDIFGQVMISTPHYSLYRNACDPRLDSVKDQFPSLYGLLPVKAKATCLPLPFKFYLHSGDGVSTKSCADLDQTMAINSLVAITMFGIIQNLVFSRPVTTPRLNITLEGTSPEFLTPQYAYINSLNTSINMRESDENLRKESYDASVNDSRLGLFSRRTDFMSVGDFLSPLTREMHSFNLKIEQKRKQEEEKKRLEEIARKQEERKRAIEAKAKAEEDRLKAEADNPRTPETDEAIDVDTGVKKKPARKIAAPPLTPIPPAPPTRLEIPEEFRT